MTAKQHDDDKSSHSDPQNKVGLRLIRWPEVQSRLGGRSFSAVYRDERAGLFPKRVRFARGVAWVEQEIDEYLLNLPRGTRSDSQGK